MWDFPGGPVVKTPHFQCRDTGSSPDQGTKIPHAVQCGQKLKKKNGNNPCNIYMYIFHANYIKQCYK